MTEHRGKIECTGGLKTGSLLWHIDVTGWKLERGSGLVSMLDRKHTPSMRVSLNPQFLNYDPVCDSGINAGYNNREQTVGAGESKKYLWFADKEYGACMIQSFEDMRNHRYHGLFGTILIEPPGARWYRNFSMAKAAYEEETVITAPGVDSFRECVVLIQNGIRMLDKTGELTDKSRNAGFAISLRRGISDHVRIKRKICPP